MISEINTPAGSEVFMCSYNFFPKRYFVLNWNNGWLSLGDSKKQSSFSCNFRPGETENVYKCPKIALSERVKELKELTTKLIENKYKEIEKLQSELVRLNNVSWNEANLIKYDENFEHVDF